MNVRITTINTLLAIAKAVGTIATAITIVFSMLWFLASPRLEPYIELPEKVVDLGSRIDNNFDEQGRAISRLQSDVKDLRLVPKVTEYDTLLSKMITPQCSVGQVCAAEYVVRRTDQGVTCGIPSAQRYVRNHNGIIRPAAIGGVRNPVKVGTDWITLNIKFIIPDGVRLGKAEFFMGLEYPGCSFAIDGATVKEGSLPLFFEVVEP
jgi:hypothetical protein